jgi:hypothetical protein
LGGAAWSQAARLYVTVCLFERWAFLFTATPRTRKEFLPRQSLLWLRGRTIGALRVERHSLASAYGTQSSACHELLCSRVFIYIVLRSARHPQIPPRFIVNFSQGEFGQCPFLSRIIPHLLCLCNARAFSRLPAVLAIRRPHGSGILPTKDFTKKFLD